MMVATAVVTCGLVVLLLAASAQAQDTTGQKLDHAPGYTFGSNVEGYLRLSTDICDMKKAIGTGDNPSYAEAKKIYVDGKNSKKSDGSIRTLRSLAAKSYAGEPVFDLYAKHFKTAAFLDQPISFALAGDEPYLTVPQRNETITKGLEAAFQVAYLLHELDEAENKIQGGNLSPTKGAPHNVDETWAIYAGITPDCSPWGTANKRAADFGTMQDCTTSKVNAAMATAHRRLYEASVAGDLRAFQAQKKEVIRLLLITYIQATLKYAEMLDKATAANDQKAMEADQAEGAMYFRTIEPFVAQANNNSAATITRVLTPGNPIPPNTLAIVKPALERAYPKLNIDKADIGTFGTKQTLGCVAKSSAGTRAPAVVASGLAALLSVAVMVLLGA